MNQERVKQESVKAHRIIIDWEEQFGAEWKDFLKGKYNGNQYIINLSVENMTINNENCKIFINAGTPADVPPEIDR